MPQRKLNRERHELADFLRTRRKRLSPVEVGLPDTGRRRTPGLRREEVAALAGVGLSWYTWFEQGRDIGVSAAFVENVARALRLDEVERRHLFVLARLDKAARQPGPKRTVPRSLQRMLDGMAGMPAYVRNLHWDLVAWNAEADRVFDISRLPEDRRNILWMAFADPGTRRKFVQWEERAPLMLAKFRRDYAKAPEDPVMVDLVASLQRVSPEFKDWWRRHDVNGCSEGVKTILLDGSPPMTFEHTTYTVDDEPDLRLVVYAPVIEEADRPTAEAAA